MNDVTLVIFLIVWSIFTGFLMAMFTMVVLGIGIIDIGDDDDDDDHWCY